MEALDGPPGGHDLVAAWAWIDEPAGLVRARGFFERFGIAEDEATGAAAVELASERSGRPIDASTRAGARRISPRAADGGMVEIGGRVVLDEVRER